MKLVLALVAIAACKPTAPPPKGDVPGTCLQLPGAIRTNLAADPKGGALYWFEPANHYKFTGELVNGNNLVRYDLAAHHLDVILDRVELPLQILQDRVIVRHLDGTSASLAEVDRNGRVQLLLPDYLAPVDVERIDDRTLAVLAEGDGARAVYTLDLERPRPHHLIDADVLLGTWGGRVLVLTVDGKGISVEPDGSRKDLSLPKDTTHPVGQNAYYIDNETVHARKMIAGDDRVVVTDHMPWVITLLNGYVLVRTPPGDHGSEAVMLTGGAPKRLPSVLGGATILGATQLGTQTWALVAHNTANYNGDVGESIAETDVCLLPTTGPVTFPTRNAPQRYAAKLPLVQAALANIAPNASLQILDTVDFPAEIYIELKENGGNDLEAMRKRVRELAEHVTALLGDREIRTDVRFADDRVAIQRWRRDRLRFRASVGFGDALTSDPADFDAEISDFVNKRDKDKILCSGTLANTHEKPLEHLEVRCIAGDRTNVIAIPRIGPHESVKFSHAFEVEEDATALFEVVSNREPLEIRDAASEDHMRKVFELASAVRDETGLSMESHVGATGSARFRAPESFASRSDEERTDIAAAVYRRFEALHTIYSTPTATRGRAITIAIDRGQTLEYDGVRLSVVE